MGLSASFSPLRGRVGTTTQVTVAFDSTVARVDVQVYSTPGVTPSSELGWFYLGSIAQSGASLDWDTSRWNPGSYAVALVAYDFYGRVAASWPGSQAVQQYGARSQPLVQYAIDPAGVPLPGTGTTGSNGSTGVPDGTVKSGPTGSVIPGMDTIFGIPTNLALLGLVGGLGFLWWRSRG